MENFTLFDFIQESQGTKYRPLPSTDWKWSMKDGYPKEKNGLKVFSCFACGGGEYDGVQTRRVRCVGVL